MSSRQLLKRVSSVASLLAFSLMPALAFGQAVTLEKGTLLQVGQQIKLRASPPSQNLIFIGEPGKETNDVKSGEQVRVESVSKVKVPFGEHTWVKVKTQKGDSGWAFYGTDDKSQNFLVKK